MADLVRVLFGNFLIRASPLAKVHIGLLINKLKLLWEKRFNAYQNYLVKDRKVSRSTQNQAINAIKFYYEKVLGGERKTYYIDRPRKERKLPQIISESEVMRMLIIGYLVKDYIRPSLTSILVLTPVLIPSIIYGILNKSEQQNVNYFNRKYYG